jgi:predicted DNA-binding transcriptional regulator YafY
MSRSSNAEKVQRLNAAFEMLRTGRRQAEAVEALCGRFALSRRQAYRYLVHAKQLKSPAAAVEATLPITIKVPAHAVEKLRRHARASGLTMGEIVARAISGFVARSKRHG